MSTLENIGDYQICRFADLYGKTAGDLLFSMYSLLEGFTSQQFSDLID